MKAVLVAILCLTQGYNCQRNETAEAITELGEEINILKVNISLRIRENGQLLGRTRATIGRLIGHAQANIQSQLSQLEVLIDEAKNEAEAKNADISACLGRFEEGVTAVDVKTLRTCSSRDDLSLLEVKMGELGALKGRAAASISDCLSTGISDAQSLRNCVHNIINSVKTSEDGISEEIELGCEDAKKNADACTGKLLGKLDRIIDQLAHELKSCLQTIL